MILQQLVDVPAVGEERGEEEDGREHLGPPHDARHGLRVHRVHGEQQTGDGGRRIPEVASRQSNSGT